MEVPRLKPSEYKPIVQRINENLVLYKLEKALRRKPTEKDRQRLAGCKCVEDFMELITETYIGDVFVKGSGAGLGRLGEFYVALRCEIGVTWESRPGYDLWGAWRYDDLVKAGKIEVKTCGILPKSANSWQPRIAGGLDKMVADVVVIICMTDSYNPCYAKMFVIPQSALVETFKEQKTRCSKRRPRIAIAQNEINNHTKTRNRWYEFLLIDHTKLKGRIREYIHGRFVITTVEQLALF